MTSPVWRVSTFSGQNGSCVAVAEFGDTIAIRNSNDPDGPTLRLSRRGLAEWIAGCRSGQFDDLT